MLLELSVPVGALGLVAPEASLPSLTVEFERTVFASDCTSLVVVSDEDAASTAAAFRERPIVEDVLRVDEVEDGVVYRLSWGETLPDLFQRIREFDGALLRASSHDGKWHLAIRFPDRVTMSKFYVTYDDSAYPITIHRISASEPAVNASEDRLTPTQRKVLRRAWEGGYFDIPRRMPLTELADEFDVSDTATSQTLRRGTANLLGRYLGGSKRNESVNPPDN
ncbi:helix-turn-helix domain-containing protein [Halogeometricum luteum]|uniref:Helix-turn-helix domain-containing protein n=1 Tax=Halogeometricum luteum TaxID=2950537 RepID=A0ABU2G6M9_9EURY|nr:helix-turn-helix domain-containing protein [Halogeometricum sp. S3BR5-2]MDS0296136.1 helix-turn-helix domain-containing protein [Halogeometricum sp. S3BR5-2]